MSESEDASTKADLEALKALKADASKLEQIEGLLNRFNVFEAIGFCWAGDQAQPLPGLPSRSRAKSWPRALLS
jgi:hypothetical protein